MAAKHWRRVIAIDGPSGAGKSSVARQLAHILGYYYVDSGAMYRAAGWVVQAQTPSPGEVTALIERTPIEVRLQDGQSTVWVNGQDITDQLGGEGVGEAASAVAVLPAVRDLITTQLRRLCSQADLVMEGRDIGTVVFPDATLKFFLHASLEKRGQRRWHEMCRAGHAVTLAQVIEAMAARDARDQSRTVSPLLCASEAYVIDTTDLAVDDIVQIMVSEVQRNILQDDG